MRLYAMKEYVGTEVGSLNPEAGINKVAENTKFMIAVAPTRHGITRRAPDVGAA